MTQNDELLGYMIEEGEGLLVELEYADILASAANRYIADLEKQVSDALSVKADLHQAQVALERNAQVIKELKKENDNHDLRGYIGCFLLGCLFVAVAAWVTVAW